MKEKQNEKNAVKERGEVMENHLPKQCVWRKCSATNHCEILSWQYKIFEQYQPLSPKFVPAEIMATRPNIR